MRKFGDRLHDITIWVLLGVFSFMVGVLLGTLIWFALGGS